MQENKKQQVVAFKILMPTKLGFHLRVISRFVKCVREFHSVVRVRKGKIKADGRNIIGLMLLAVPWKTEICIEAEGDDAPQLIEAIKTFFYGES